MRTAWIASAALAVALGCGGGEPNQHAGIEPDAGAAGANDAGTGGGGGDAGAVTPGSPVLLSATLVTHGTMALSWRNPASTCATVVLNRKMDPGAYAVAQTLTGQATSAQDSPGHANGTYCYTVTCTLDGLSSTPSNEKCVTQ